MAAKDKIKALQLVERISRHKLETLGAELAELRAQQAAIDRQKDDLVKKAREEARQSTTHTRPYLTRYLASVDDQQRIWAKELLVLEDKAAHLETKVLGAFGELKTRETIRVRAERDQAQEVDRAEASVLDDAGRTLFLMNRDGSVSRKLSPGSGGFCFGFSPDSAQLVREGRWIEWLGDNTKVLWMHQ